MPVDAIPGPGRYCADKRTETPLIMSTARGEEAAVEELQKRGRVRFLQKPYEIDALPALVAKSLSLNPEPAD